MAVNLHQLDLDAIEKRERQRGRNNGWALGGALALSLIWLMPFYYLALSIFKTTEEYSLNHPLAFPAGIAPVVGNIVTAWTEARMGYAMANSALYGVVGAGLATLFAALAAFGLTRLDFRGKSLWFMTIFAGTVFPLQMYLIPLFFHYLQWGILNTHIGMLIFYTAICIPFPTLVLMNFMNGLSREMDEAARMDGAGELTVFRCIVLPNALGPMAAVFLLQFTWIWNDLLFSTVLGNSTATRSIMNALQVFQGSYSSTGPNVVLTAALIASMPSLVLFLALRKQFMEGLRITNL